MNWKSRLYEGVNKISRDDPLNQGRLTEINNHGKTLLSNGRSNTMKSLNKTESSKDILAELVVLRTRQESIRDFIAQCGIESSSGSWSKKTKRSAVCLFTVLFSIILNCNRFLILLFCIIGN